MEVLIEKKMIDIKTEPVELVVDHHHHHHSKSSSRRRSTSPPTELEPCEEFPILYGLLTAPKSFKPKNSEELQLIPMSLSPPPQEEDEVEDNEEVTMRRRNEVIEGQEGGGVVVTSRVQLVQCRRPSRQRRRRRSHSSECTAAAEEEFQDNFSVSLMEEADSQNLDFCSSVSRSSSSRSRSSSSASRSTRTADSCSNSNMSGSGGGIDENSTSPTFRNYISGNNENIDVNSHNNENDMAEDNEEELHRASSPGGASCSSAGSEDSSIDDNIPTSTTSGFKRKATRLETAIGNIVRRRGKVQKRSNNNNDNSNNSGSSTVPISMAPSSPTVSTTVVDPPPQQPAVQPQRGRSEILERILRSNTTNTVNPASHNQNQHSAHFPASRHDANNNNDQEPYAKLRDLLTMSEDQLVKRRRIEYGLSENKVQHQQAGRQEQEQQPTRRRGFSPPRSNILASLLQKGREPTSAPYHHPQHGILRSPPALMSINKLSDSSANNNTDDERPYKCSLCDLRFKKLPLLNRHVKTHSHIKRYVCRFCSHAFKRSDNLLAHMRTSCKGIKETDANFAHAPSPQVSRSNSNSRAGQIIPQLLSSPPTAGGPVSPLVSRSQLEEALLNLRAESAEKRYNNSPSPLVSTTTGSPPPPPTQRASRQIQPGADFQSRHSKLLEILSGSPVIAHHHPHNGFLDGGDEEDEDEDTEEVGEAEVMPIPLSLKVDRRSSQNQGTVSSSSSSSQSQFRRSHHHRQQLERVLYSRNMNELPLEEVEAEDDTEEVEVAVDSYRRGYDLYNDIPEEEENDNEQPLNLGRPCVPAPAPPPVAAQSARSRDHPEIVSILSRQPKNVMMGPDLRKLVGLDTL